jgi:Protein of unknown function (DUF1488)
VRGHVAFPNGSRSYDATRLAVRFWGYDQSMDVPFFISAAVLGALQPASAEKPEDCLSAFAPTAPGSAPSPRRFTNGAVVGSYDLLASDC